MNTTSGGKAWAKRLGAKKSQGLVQGNVNGSAMVVLVLVLSETVLVIASSCGAGFDRSTN